MHTRGPWSSRPVARSTSVETNAQSKRALCATNTHPSSACSRASTIASKGGASRTSFASMPVRPATNCGIGMPGLTSEWNATVPSSMTTAISMIRSPRKARTPVVSTSTTAQRQASKVGLVSLGGAATVQRPSVVLPKRGSGASSAAAMRSAVCRLACAIPSTSRTIARLAAGPLCKNDSARDVSDDAGTAARPFRDRLVAGAASCSAGRRRRAPARCLRSKSPHARRPSASRRP